MIRTRPSNHAFALLLVLGAVAVLAPALALGARHAVTTRLAIQRELHARITHDLLASTDPIMRRWLDDRSAQVVLAPDTATPRVNVLDVSWTDGVVPYRLVITAWDQAGMVPRGDWPLADLDLSSEMEAAHKVLAVSELPSLEGLMDRARGALSVYPKHHEESATVGSLLATHNPVADRGGTRTRANQSSVNVNTMPMRLLESLMREAGRGGIEAITEARSAAVLAPLPSRSLASRQGNRDQLRFVSVSPVWSFRADATAGRVTRSWWCVYLNGSSGWILEYRHAIAE